MGRLLISSLLLTLLTACASSSGLSLSSLDDVDSPAARVVAQRSGQDAAADAQSVDSDVQSSPFSLHGLNVFLGYAAERAGGGLKIGADYEWRFSELFGVGVFANYIYGDFHVLLLGAMVFVHPWQELVFFVGPGVEMESGKEETAEDPSGDQNTSLIRVGTFYEFPVYGDLKIAPTVMLDFMDTKKDVLIFGLNLVIDF